MSKTKQWQQRRKNEQYYKQAKTEGYRSRAAYKLKQINNKFKVLRPGYIVLDLGASPGGWSQVAVELVGINGRVVGVDLQPINPVKNVIFLEGDITEGQIIELIKEHLSAFGAYGVNTVLSDVATNISGNYSIDQAKSVYLAEAALKIAKELLVLNGNFVVKVFEGEDFNHFFSEVKETFRRSRRYSPSASRARSSEIYVLGLGKKNALEK